MINYNDVEKWRNNSILTAADMNLFPKDILNELKEVPITIIDEPLPKDLTLIYGFVSTYFFQDGKRIYKVNIFHENYSKSFDDFFWLLKQKELYSSELESLIRRLLTQEDLFEIYNQSGMDHELLGHIGNRLIGKKGNEEDACITQYKLAEYREQNDDIWKLVAEFIPLFQEKHREIPKDMYH
jgi:hypothetical protein